MTPRSDEAIQHLKTLESRRFPIQHLKAMAPDGEESLWLKKMWECLENEYTTHHAELKEMNLQVEKSVAAGMEAFKQMQQWEARANLAEEQAKVLKQQLDAKDETPGDMSEGFKDERGTMGELEDDFATKIERVASLKAELAKMKVDNKAALEAARAGLAELKSSSEAEIGQLKGKEQELSTSLETTKEEHIVSMGETKIATEEVQNLTYKIAEMKKQLEQYKSLDQEFKEMMKQGK